ncbi:hypothetical protein HK405_006824 [Cladochytrium tenue]|nr:hypothetical protein HK405_006824 [Cladochytrium tenue]
MQEFYDDMSRNGTVDGRRVKIDWDIGKSKKGIENPPRRDDRGGGGERDRGARDYDRERDRGAKDYDRERDRDYDRDYAGDGYGRSAPSGSRGGR